MRTRECPNCHGQFSSSGSYRVHKHRYHREPSSDQAQAKHDNILTSKHDKDVIRYHASESRITPSSIQHAHANMQQASRAPQAISQSIPKQAPRNEVSMEVDQADMQPPEDTMRMALADSVMGMLQQPEPKADKYDSIILVGLGALAAVAILAALFSKKPDGSD